MIQKQLKTQKKVSTWRYSDHCILERVLRDFLLVVYMD